MILWFRCRRPSGAARPKIVRSNGPYGGNRQNGELDHQHREPVTIHQHHQARLGSAADCGSNAADHEHTVGARRQREHHAGHDEQGIKRIERLALIIHARSLYREGNASRQAAILWSACDLSPLSFSIRDELRSEAHRQAAREGATGSARHLSAIDRIAITASTQTKHNGPNCQYMLATFRQMPAKGFQHD